MPSDPPPRPRPESTSLSARAQAILDEVERLAVLARQRLGRPLDTSAAEAQVKELIDDVGQRAETMRGALDELIHTLEDLERRLTATGQRLRGPSEAPAPGAESPVSRPGPPGPRARIGATDSARLVAIEMAVAGSSRQEVGRRLRDELGVEHPEPLLDDVFGAATGPHTRMPWGG